VLRILDANANRAGEGLRVVEEFARLGLDDSHLTGALKQLRHELQEALSGVELSGRLAARDTQADVGATVSTPQEAARRDVASVVAASFARVEQSLRCLEEYGKLAAAGAPQGFPAAIEQLRYRLYTLQRAVQISVDSHRRLARTQLYALIDGGETCDALSASAERLIAAGVDAIQLRDKRLDDRQLLHRARRLRELIGQRDTLLIVNDRPDLAVLARADGVHVGQEELAVKDVRTIVGPEMLIGVSTHSIEQARAAVLDGANYIGVGPTFASQTKQFDALPGVELVRTVSAEIALPAFAIGGIDVQNVEQVVQAGARRIAVGAAVQQAADVPAVVAALRRALPAL